MLYVVIDKSYSMEFIFLVLIYSISIMYITLAERKLMGRMQIRIGPELFLQSLCDGMKLIIKSKFIIKQDRFVYNIIIIITLLISITMLLIVPIKYKIAIIVVENSLISILILSSLSIYSILYSGYNSKSLYGILGSLRCINQLISYEVYIGLLINIIVTITNSLNLNTVLLNQIEMTNIYFLNNILILFLTVIMCETNRPPFDLAESESELVAGFQIEYNAVLLSLILLSEYGILVILSNILIILIFNNKIIFILLIVITILTLRASYPRIRQDIILLISWKYILPISINLLIIYINLSQF